MAESKLLPLILILIAAFASAASQFADDTSKTADRLLERNVDEVEVEVEVEEFPLEGEIDADDEDDDDITEIGGRQYHSETSEICSHDRLANVMLYLPTERVTVHGGRHSSGGNFSIPINDDRPYIELDLKSKRLFRLVEIEINGNVETIEVKVKVNESDWFDPNSDLMPVLDHLPGGKRVALKEFGAAGIRVDRVRVYPLRGSNDTEASSYEGTLSVLVCEDRNADFILENDMAYNKQQYNTLFQDSKESSSSSNRSTYGGTYRSGTIFWPNGQVPYVIEPKHFNKQEMDEIREAMDVYEATTCVRFVRKTNQKNYLYLRHTNDGCYSSVGMNGGGQVVSLKTPGCRTMGTYLHELGHALGLLHEHQMPDRDYYLKFYDVNVDPAQLSQLKKYAKAAVQTYGSTYDLGSIMHYNVMAFSIDDRSYTLSPNDPWAIQYIGRTYSNQLSFGDVRTVTHIYKCAAQWGCRNQCPGMTYHDKNCKCVTPSEHHEKFCKNEPGIDSFCDEVALKSECDPRLLALHKNCARSCDFCPRFKPGQTALTMPAKCRNIYPYQDKCLAWAKAGFCNKPHFKRFLHRYCRLSCQACTSSIGKCPNYLSNAICDEKLATRKCGHPGAATKCRDSCSTCLWRQTDPSCKNNMNSVQCAMLAQKNQCEERPFQMFAQCPSTCKRCYYNKGSCKNLLSEKYCFQRMRANLCVSGPPAVMGMDLHQTTLKDCPRTCGKCS